MFLDRDPYTSRLYYEFETESGAIITTTPSHLLFVAGNDVENKTIFNAEIREEFAQDIQIGQYLHKLTYKWLKNDDEHLNQSKFDRIIQIRTKVGYGSYAPLTNAGNLIVNNITASCYAIIRSQHLSHWSFYPIRFIHSFVKFGDYISQWLDVQKHRRYNPVNTNSQPQVGIHWYPQMLHTLFKYLIPKNLLYQ